MSDSMSDSGPREAEQPGAQRLHTATATVFLRPVISAPPPSDPPPPVPDDESSTSLVVDEESPRVWSTMTTRIESSTSVKQWSTPLEKTIEGHPPGPSDHPNTIEGESRSGVLRGITPNYKLGSEKPDTKIDLPYSGYIPNSSGDYTVKQQQQHYKLTVIDPKVRTSANMPALSATLPDPLRSRAGDFPSEHTKRSFVKVDPLESRKLKAVDTRPVTTSAYLTESVQRHRDMEASRLREYLRAKEGDANQPWNKPDWPGHKTGAHTDESLRELDSIKEKIATLQRGSAERGRTEELDAMARKTEELSRRARENRSGYHLTESEIVTTKVEPSPKPLQDVSSSWLYSEQSFSPRSVVSVNGALREEELLRVRSSTDHLRQDDKPRSIMKRRELENREQMLYPAENYRHEVVREAAHRPVKTETVQRFEQTKRTEEVERRVQRKERKDRRSRHHSSSRREEWREGSHGGGQWRSASLSRHGGGHAGYLPSNESYFRQTTTRRDNSHGGYEDDRAFGNGIAHARYGSLSDSLRRGELKYIPNGEVRESHYRDGGRSGQSFHKSYSTRDVFDDRGGYDRSSVISQGRRGSQGTQPFVEFPPTLPRRGREESFHPMHKARSFADWDDQSRAGWRRSDDWAVQQQQQQQHQQHRRRDDEMSRLEDEFRDSLLMPMPNGNVHERDHRTEQIPGGYETYHKENRANAGRRYNRDGVPIDYSEATQEYNFKREQETDGRRR